MGPEDCRCGWALVRPWGMETAWVTGLGRIRTEYDENAARRNLTNNMKRSDSDSFIFRFDFKFRRFPEGNGGSNLLCQLLHLALRHRAAQEDTMLMDPPPPHPPPPHIFFFY